MAQGGYRAGARRPKELDDGVLISAYIERKVLARAPKGRGERSQWIRDALDNWIACGEKPYTGKAPRPKASAE